MPEEKKVTIGPRTTPPVTPWDAWAWKWFGGGPFGSAAFSPQRWLGSPSGSPSWGPQMPAGEEPTELWQLANRLDAKAYKSRQEYERDQPWRIKGLSREQYESALQSAASRQATDWYTQMTTGKTPAQLQLEEEGKRSLEVPMTEAERRRQELSERQFTGEQGLATQREQTRQNMALAEAMQAQFNRDWAETQRQGAWAARGAAPISGDVRGRQVLSGIAAMGGGAYGRGEGGGGNWFPAARAMAEARQELEQRSWGFEKMREQIMATSAPRDWVVREKARLALNPYEAEKVKMQGHWGAAIPQVPVNPEPQYSAAPQVPQNVQPFLGKEKTFGGALETPSGQAWAAAPWSTREALIGYSEALGHPEADLLGAMQAMRPNAPSRGTSWAPARRR